MKKIIIIASVLILTILGYMIIAGMIEKNVQQSVQERITDLTNHGFDIEKIKKDQKSDHYILTFKDMQKITPFIQGFNVKLSANTIDALQDMEIALDVQNNHGFLDDIKIEIYPIKLPSEMKNSLDADELKAIEQHLKQKTFMLYLSFDKSLSDFKGHLQDIDIKELKKELKIQGDTFNGKIKSGKIISYEENIKEFSFKTDEKNIVRFSDMYTAKRAQGKDTLEKHYTLKAKTFFMALQESNATVDNLDVDFSWIANDTTVDASIKGTLGALALNNKDQMRAFEGIILDVDIKNINQTLISKINKNKLKDIDEFSKLMSAKNPIVTINTFEAKKIKQDKVGTEGFQIQGEIRSDASKSSDQDIYKSLMVNGKLTLSRSLFDLLSQNPSMDILFMLIPQNLKEDHYIYDIHYDDTLTVNKERIL
jgi:hypothetical protein